MAPSEIIYNPLTKQGTKSDVAQNFTISDAIGKTYSHRQVRALVGSEAIPRKVVDYLPKVMSDVQFDVQVAGTSSDDNEDDTIWITDQIRSLIPWMTEGQIVANTVGKAYLVFDRYQEFYEEDRLTDIQTQPKTQAAEMDNQTDDTDDADGTESISPLDELLNMKLDTGSDSDYELTPDEKLQEKLPLPFPIDWSQEIIESVYGVQILPGDFYGWTPDGEYLYRNTDSALRGKNSFQGERKINLSSKSVVKWVQNQKEHVDDDDKMQKSKYLVVHRSHVIELFAFDYQDDTIYDDKKTLIIGENNRKKPRTSHRITRFIPAFLRYASFLNATLNRIHRSEFLAYAKENLGDLALDIARAMAESNLGSGATGTATPEEANANVMLVMQQEMQRILDSAMNQGLVMYDAKHKLDIVSRTFTGLKDFNNIFRDNLIAASGLTEFVLFGINSAGTGLASMDIRDRKFIADQSDSLWADHWMPPLLHLANLLSMTKDLINLEKDVLKIRLEKSFKLTDTELAEWVERVINSRAKLLEARVLTPAMVLKELSSDSMLGQHFTLVKEDVVAHLEKLEALGIDEIGSANRSGGLYPIKTTEIKAESVKEASEISAESKLNVVKESAKVRTGSESGTLENPSSNAGENGSVNNSDTSDNSSRQGDKAPKWKIQGVKNHRLWKRYLNMTDDDIRDWLSASSGSTYAGASGTKNTAGRVYANKVIKLRNKPANAMTQEDYRAVKKELDVIHRLVNQFKKTRTDEKVRHGKSVLSRSQVSLRNHGVKV